MLKFFFSYFLRLVQLWGNQLKCCLVTLSSAAQQYLQYCFGALYSDRVEIAIFETTKTKEMCSAMLLAVTRQPFNWHPHNCTSLRKSEKNNLSIFIHGVLSYIASKIPSYYLNTLYKYFRWQQFTTSFTRRCWEFLGIWKEGPGRFQTATWFSLTLSLVRPPLTSVRPPSR